MNESLIDEIGFDKREIILHGDTNSLDGYRVRASDKYGVMALYNFDKPGNATYVMSLQQGLFFLNKMTRDNKKVLTSGNIYVIIFLKLSKEVYL